MNLISKVQAQGIDAYASPTIPFEPPVGPSYPTGSVVTPIPNVPYIILDSSYKNVAPGEQFEVTIIVNTQGTPIQELAFSIDYDTNLLKVIDPNGAASNKKIFYINTFFIPTQHTIDETTNVGNIYIKASSEENGSTTVSGQQVAIITFEAQAEGFAKIEVIKDESALITSNSTDILEFTNLIDVTVSTSTTTPNVTSTVNPSNIGVSITYPSRTPDTAFTDYLSTKSYTIGGILLISLGLIILKNIKNAKLQR